MLAYLITDVLIVLGFLLVGFVVILKNNKAILNQLFLGFVVTISAWVLANYFSNDFHIGYTEAQLANHMTLFAPGLVLILLLNFALRLAGGHATSKKWLTISGIYFFVYWLALTPLVFDNVHKQGNVYAIDFKALGSLYFLALISNMILVVAVLVRERHKAKGELRARLGALLWGVSALLGVNVATNALLPALGNTFALTNIGPLSGIFVIYALWYSIVKHRLFDIRMLITRSLGYAMSLGALAGIFVAGAFTFTDFIFQGSHVETSTLRWIYAILAAVSAFLFAPLKNFFDKVSNKVFFRDSYDTQALLDEFNKNLVGTYELDLLLKNSANILLANLKPTYSVFAVMGTANTRSRMVGSDTRKQFDTHDMHGLDRVYARAKRRVVTPDMSETEPRPLIEYMRDKDMGLVTTLVTTTSHSRQHIGYLILGPKKSGNMYSSQDLKVVEIIANELVIAIQNALRFEEIENFNVTLQQRIDDATRKLRRANEKLKELDETKDDFISMASHQLRTPLTSVKGYLSMVIEGDVGKVNKQQKEMLTQAFFSSQRMVYLIADLLNVSRLKTGKFVIEPAPTNLAELVEQELSQVRETAKIRNIELVYDKPKQFPQLMLDETKTRQVVMNYVDNAIYYTPAGGKIEVQLTETPSSVELRVVDNGIGVPRAEQPHLFTKFYRAGNARKARPDGTGLGLFMAKKVVAGQGGAVIFESQEGKGSTFGFVFSKARLGVGAAPMVPASKKAEPATAK